MTNARKMVQNFKNGMVVLQAIWGSQSLHSERRLS